ncbi:MAG: hypothetical protein LBR19_07935 [Bifidobacteriaceae bacterium]|nr:hypothetical protein [Bifidobacteriaceae bacterium]
MGLVLAWAVGVFFGLRWLWRRAKAFMEELGHLSDALAVLEDPHGRFQAAEVPAPLPDLATALERHRAAQGRKRTKRQAKRARHQAAYDRWLQVSGWGER